ncbi:MAG: hypothetical protein ACK6BG_11585 [Cyanobacteriota bacterium]
MCNTNTNQLDATRIAADKTLNPNQNLRSDHQITKTHKPLEEFICMAGFSHPTAVVSLLRPSQDTMLDQIKAAI